MRTRKDTPDRSWLYITCTVVAVHFLCLGWAIFSQSDTLLKQPKPPQRLVVQTIALNTKPFSQQSISPEDVIKPEQLPAKSNVAQQPEPISYGYGSSHSSSPPLSPPSSTVKQPPKPATPPPPKEPPKSKEPPKPKEPPKSKVPPNTSPKPAATPTKPAIKPEPQKTSQIAEVETKKLQEEQQKKKEAQVVEVQRQQKLVAEAQERIAKISGNRDTISSKTTSKTLASVPTAITSLEIDGLSSPKDSPVMSQYEMSYRDELAARLKLLLRLPEYGDVKVNLTLKRSGKVDNVKVISAESVLNRKYIEKTLPELSFPSFGSNFASASEYTFSITLSNEI